MSDSETIATRPLTSGANAAEQQASKPIASAVRNRIGGLDFLRAISVFFVMLDHSMDAASPAAWRLAGGGLSSLGVEIFFVLSGFLITLLLLEEHESKGHIDYLAFYRRRVARLMPVFYLFLMLAIMLLWVRGREIPWPAVISAILYVVNYYQGLTGAETNIVAHCWSLAVEEQFYLIWPIAAGAILTRRASLARTLIAVILVVWALRAVLLWSGQVPISYLYRALETRADHLGVGCLVAVAIRTQAWRLRFQMMYRWKYTIPLVWLVLYVSARADAASNAYKYLAGFVIEPVLIGLLIPLTILASAGNGWSARLVVNNAALAHLGRISYGVYLFHGVIMYTAQRIVMAWTGSFALSFVAACIAIIGFASFVFRWYEIPTRHWINSRLTTIQSPGNSA